MVATLAKLFSKRKLQLSADHQNLRRAVTLLRRRTKAYIYCRPDIAHNHLGRKFMAAVKSDEKNIQHNSL
jgi:hypothetical protein